MTTETHALTAPSRVSRSSWRRFAISFAITLVAVFALAVMAAFTYARLNDGRVLPGVSVDGVSLAGLNAAEAETELRRTLPDLRTGTLFVQAGTVEATIGYAEVDRDYDLAAIIDQAMGLGRAGSPLDQVVQQVRTLLGNGVALTPAVTYDADGLARRVGEIVAQAQVTAVNAQITFENGQYIVSPAADGQDVDIVEAITQAMQIVGSSSPADAAVRVEPTAVPADIPTEAAQAAVDQARAVASDPLVLAIGAQSSTIQSAALLEWIELEEVAPGTWSLIVQREPIEQLVAQLKLQSDQPAVDAQFRFEEGQPVAVPGEIGREMDAAASTDMIVDALTQRAGGTAVGRLTLPVNSTVPAFGTAEAEALVSRVELLGSWTTRYVPSVSNSNGVNIRRPASLIDGFVVAPGQVFDFVEVAGPITRANGYGEGAAIIRGKTRAEGVLGGGLCSASTTIYNAALRAGLEMGARRNHAYYIDRYPVGLDATIWISGSYVQTMAFTNDTEYPIVIRGINKKRSVTFEVWGVSDGRTVDLSRPDITDEKGASNYYMFTDALAPRVTERLEYAADGFSSSVVRTVRDAAGNIIHQDTIRSNYRRVDGIVLVGRYPGDPPAGTRIPYGQGLPPAPGPAPTPTPDPTPKPPTPDPTPSPAPVTPTPTPEPTASPAADPTPEG